MVECVIFDLSEVLIYGLVGIDKPLSQELGVPEDRILPCFAGTMRDQLFLGEISEDEYLKDIISNEGWKISIEKIKKVIRDNFHHEVWGTLAILTELTSIVDLVLLSDHAREWVCYIKSIHAFLNHFQHTFFSYDLKSLKKDQQTFTTVLDQVATNPQNCLFIDDNQNNIHIAESVGIAGIRFKNAKQLSRELKHMLIEW